MKPDYAKGYAGPDLDEVLADYMQRIDRGEPVDREALIQAHPELSDKLRDYFSQASAMGHYAPSCDATAPFAGNITPNNSLQVRCPNCHELIESETDVRPVDLTCSSCGKQVAVPAVKSAASHFSGVPHVESQVAPGEIGRYLVARRLGQGGYGSVYLCQDPLARREVAVKVALAQEKSIDVDRQALLHEARVVAQLSHPHIVKVLDVGELPDDRIYLVYEYVAGKTLKSCLDEADFTREEAVEWCAEIAEALDFAHRQGVVHRDIKPANILLDKERRPLLADFGLAMRDDRFWADDRGSVVGTFSYLSPEQASGQSHWSSPQSDIYSLGTVLYQLLSGRLPFQSNDRLELLEQIQRRPPTSPRVFDNSISRDLEQVCLRALAKEPGQRFATAGDMGAALRRCLREKSPRDWTANKLALAAAILIAVCAAGLVSSTLLHPDSTSNVVATLSPPSLQIHVQRQDENSGSTPLSEQSAPLRNGDKILLQGTLSKAAYPYLFWFDTDGNSKRLWPADLADQQATNEIYSPMVGKSDGQEVHVVGGEAGTQLAVLGVSETPLTESRLAEIEHAARDLKVTSANVDRLVQRRFPPDPSRSDRSLSGTTVTTMTPISPKFDRVLHAHFEGYTILLIPHH